MARFYLFLRNASLCFEQAERLRAAGADLSAEQADKAGMGVFGSSGTPFRGWFISWKFHGNSMLNP